MSHEKRAILVGERLDVIRRLLDDRRAPAALLSARRNFAWATAGGENHVVLSSETGVAGLLVTRTDALVLTAVNEAPRIADEELVGLGLEVHALPWHDEGAMAREAERLAGGPPLDDAALEDALWPMRAVLDQMEMTRMSLIAGAATAAAADALATVHPGVREREVAASATASLAGQGVRVPVLLAAADDRISRYRHPLPGERRVEHRLMLVIVAERWGLHVAVTRLAELRPPDADLAARIAAAAQIHTAMIQTTRDGRTLGDVLEAARDAYADAGHPDEWRLHHQGGIIGYQGRERIAVPGDPTVIRAGMAFAWNPSVAGAKTEETMLLDADGPRLLTRP
ncbi:MAG: M24 family metallopeptidase [Chloroflexota bacterium]|nr:M24 family metallopeptidase [Chloroflexota bacterium]